MFKALAIEHDPEDVVTITEKENHHKDIGAAIQLDSSAKKHESSAKHNLKASRKEKNYMACLDVTSKGVTKENYKGKVRGKGNNLLTKLMQEIKVEELIKGLNIEKHKVV